MSDKNVTDEVVRVLRGGLSDKDFLATINDSENLVDTCPACGGNNSGYASPTAYEFLGRGGSKYSVSLYDVACDDCEAAWKEIWGMANDKERTVECLGFYDLEYGD